jgi:nitroimidazol reductase NimA-like FMN-containing flavoprotein (pyridoxamine 5'-phosphate oxidase superfamily)
MKILNASEPSLGSSMTEEETRDFLSNTTLFARLGTIDEKTDPNVHPVWYYFDNGKIYFQTGKTLRT